MPARARDLSNGRHWLIGSLILLTLLVSGCASAAGRRTATRSGPPPAQRQVLRIAVTDSMLADMPSAPLFLDPTNTFPTDTYDAIATTLLYNGLTTLNPQQKPILWDADHLAISADGLTYTFHLRAGLRFSDGSPITAADVAYSLDRALNPCTLSIEASTLYSLRGAIQFASQTCDIYPVPTIVPSSGQPVVTTLIGDGIQTSGSATLALHLARPDAALLTKLAMPVAAVVERTLIARYPGVTWTQHLSEHGGQGTSGLYRLKAVTPLTTGPHASDQLTFVPNSAARGDTPMLSEIDLLLFAQAGDARTAYLAGQVDIAMLGPGEARAATADISYSVVPLPDLFGIQLDWKTPPFDDARVRQAFALALDRTRLAALFAPDALTQVTNHLIPEGTPGYNPALADPLGGFPHGDPARARALWLSYVRDRCGGDAAQCPRVTWIDPLWPLGSQAFQRATMAMVRSALPGFPFEEVGGTIKEPACTNQIQGLDWLGGDFPDPQDWLALPFDPVEGHYCITDTATLQALAQADALTSTAQRFQAFQSAEAALLGEVAVIPLFQAIGAVEARPYIVGYEHNAWDLLSQPMWANVYITAH